MLRNKTALITGASSGIGAACAKYFAANGTNLLLCARKHDVIQVLADKLASEYSVDIQTFKLDVTNKNAVDVELDRSESVDILINNAGLAAGLDAIQDASIDDWEAMIDTNIKGLLYVTRKIVPKMIRKKSGHIVNVGSIAGHQVYPKGAVYCATKFAVNALTQGLRMDLLGTNVRVTTVDPGAVQTNFSRVRFKGDEKKAADIYTGFEPLTADDIADAILYCVTRPPHINVDEIIIMPTAQASATMIHRE